MFCFVLIWLYPSKSRLLRPTIYEKYIGTVTWESFIPWPYRSKDIILTLSYQRSSKVYCLILETHKINPLKKYNKKCTIPWITKESLKVSLDLNCFREGVDGWSGLLSTMSYIHLGWIILYSVTTVNEDETQANCILYIV